MFQSLEARICLLVGGVFFMTALLVGIWKYRAMLEEPSHRAPVYVDIAHRAALMYAFAAVLLAHLVAASPFPRWLNLAAVVLPLFFFGVAIATYISLGAKRVTDNQFEEKNFGTTWGMWALIVSEVGGFGVLLTGYVLGAF